MKNRHFYVLYSSTPIIMIAKSKTYLFQKPRRQSKMYTTIKKARDAVRSSDSSEKIEYQLFTSPLHYVSVLLNRDDDRNPWLFVE